MNPDPDGTFEEIANRAGNPVGEYEIRQRQLIGDERYEEVRKHNDALADANLEQATRLVGAIEALGFQRNALGVAAIIASLGVAFAGVAFLVIAVAR